MSCKICSRENPFKEIQGFCDKCRTEIEGNKRIKEKDIVRNFLAKFRRDKISFIELYEDETKLVF